MEDGEGMAGGVGKVRIWMECSPEHVGEWDDFADKVFWLWVGFFLLAKEEGKKMGPNSIRKLSPPSPPPQQ